jgi:predicted amidohydrolase
VKSNPPGDQPFRLLILRDATVAVVICVVEWLETVRAAAEHGTHLIAVPTAQIKPSGFIADTVASIRLDNQVYVANAKWMGSERDRVYVGSIASSDGTIVTRCESGPQLSLATLSSEVVRVYQSAHLYLTDRPSPYTAEYRVAPDAILRQTD